MKQITRGITVLALIGLLVPVGASAQGSSSRQEAFCSQQQERQAKVLNRFTERGNSYKKAKRTQSLNQLARSNGRNEAVAKIRAEADSRRVESYNILASQQDTEERIQRVKAFSAEVEAAVAARRDAYDKARAVYQDSVDKLLSVRINEMDKAVSAFRGSAEAALETAAGQCQNAPAERAKIRQTMITSLRQARTEFSKELRTRPDYKQAVWQVIEVRKEAFRAATQTFEQTMQQIQTKYTDLKD